MLTLWRPFNELARWSRVHDDLFSWGNGERLGFSPAVDIEEREDSFLLKADLPGMSEKEIEVKVHDGVLILSGSRETSKEDKTEHGYYRERSYGSFCRQFNLGSNVDATKIEASYNSGVLKIVLPKKEEVQPKQIPVSTN